MKKWLALLLCVSLIMPAVCFAEATPCEHQRPADSSGYLVQAEAHSFLCPLCNQTIQEGHTLSDWKYDNAEHWKSCAVCGAEKVSMYLDPHYTDCTSDKTRCKECGMVGGDIRIRHGNETCHTDETGHWYTCDDCGDITQEKAAHYAICAAPNVCGDCGYAYSGEVQHIGAQTRKADATHHWYECSACNGTIQKEPHTVSCAKLGVCAVCDEATSVAAEHQRPADTSGYTAYAVQHSFVCPQCGQTVTEGHMLSEWKGDVVIHWKSCSVCGVEKINGEWADEHYVLCTGDRTRCEECGLPYNGSNVYHGDYTRHSDESAHWIICDDCNGIIGEKEAHFVCCNNQGVCADCGIAYSGALQHVGEQVRKADATHHWYECSVCNSIAQKEPHTISCAHPGVCAVCGEATETPAEHPYALCTDPGHCAVCGGSYGGEDIRHNVDEQTWQSDADSHWHVCLGCGERSDHYSHCGSCTDPSKCIVCAAPYNGEDVWHVGLDWNSPLHDESSHWYDCPTCQKQIDKQAHYIGCADPAHCKVCGAACSGGEVEHSGAYKEQMQHDETHHWYFCTDCQERQEYYPHCASCTDLTHCDRCGAPYDGSVVLHWGVDWENPLHDAAGHWYVCADCGQKVHEGAHYAVCTDPTHCADCGVPYDGKDIRHTGTNCDAWLTDGNAHWKYCDACQTKQLEDAHYAYCSDPTHCAVCGAAYSGGIVSHLNVHWQTILHDETSHWYDCEDCTQKVNELAHYAQCADSTHCMACSADFTGVAKHTAVDLTTLLSDEASCWNPCTACNGHVNEAAHTMEFASETLAAGCETAGAHLYRCTRCGHEEARAVAALEHDYRLDRKVAPKVGVKGYDLYVCANCQDTDKRNFVAALPEPVPEAPAPEAPETEEPEIAMLVESLKTELETVSEAQAPTVIEVKKTESGEGTLVISAPTPAAKTETQSAGGTTPEAEPEAPKLVAVALSTSVLSMCEEKSVTTVEIASDAGGIDVPVAALKAAVGENETCTVSVQTKTALDETEKQAVAAYTLASAACEVKLSKTGTDGAQSDLKDAGASVRIEWKPDMTDKVVAVCVIDGQAVEIAAVLVLDADGNPLYWALPYQGAGVYMMALRTQ